MINNLFNNKDSSSTSATKRPAQQQLPRDVKEAVSKCREATQAALADRTSRMTVDFPVGAKFGVEKKTRSSSNKKQQNLDSSNNKAPTRQDLQKSDRELARIFVDMFQPVGGQHLTVAFNTVEEADAARTQWKGDSSAEARILSLDRRKSAAAKKKKKAKSKAAKGFAAKLAAEIDDDDSGDKDETGPFRLPDNTEVALFVAPGPKELIVIERICESVGMGTLVVLLNSRLPSSSGSTSTNTSNNYFGSPAAEKLFITEFEPVFSLAAVTPQEAAPGCLLYRSYIASDWVLARKPAVGPPKTILAQAARPTEAECRAAWEDALEQLSGVEKNVETAMENVAQWFR